MRTSVLLLSVLLGASACRHAPELEVRKDRAPLERRVALPSSLKGVRWVAVPEFIDTGFLEAPEKPYRVYAFCDLDAPSAKATGGKSVLLPATVARAILPASVTAAAHAKGQKLEVAGGEPTEAVTARTKEVAVIAAVRVDQGLVLELFLSVGS